MLPRIIKCGYKELNLIYFFTAGEKEVRAWNIYNGSLAPQAAGAIHSDFETGLHQGRALRLRRLQGALRRQGVHGQSQSLGKYRQEGKNYVVKDGDIIEFKFNVKQITCLGGDSGVSGARRWRLGGERPANRGDDV